MPPVWAEPLRFIAAVATFCPSISLLGAKRPQDGMWNFIVLTLWGMLALPAAEVFFLQRGQTLEVNDLRAWFLWGLIVTGTVNLLPTRMWLYGLLYGCAQTVLLAEYLPVDRNTPLSLAGHHGAFTHGVRASEPPCATCPPALIACRSTGSGWTFAISLVPCGVCESWSE